MLCATLESRCSGSARRSRGLSAEFGLDHAFASERVYTDGAELIFDYASTSDDEALLTVVRTGQEHLAEVIRGYLKRDRLRRRRLGRTHSAPGLHGS